MSDNTVSNRNELEQELDAARKRVAELEHRLSVDSCEACSQECGIPPFGADLLERSRVVLWMRDAESGAFVSMSGAAAECLGFPADQLLDDSTLLNDRLHPLNTPAGWELTEFDSADELHEEEIRYFHPDGSVRWLWSRTQGAFDNEGRLTHTMGLLGDCTRHRQDMELRIEHSDMLQSVLDSIQSAIFLLDTDGRYVFVNKHFTELFGVASEELAGKPPTVIQAPLVAREFLRTNKIVLQTRQPYTTQISLPVRDSVRDFLTTKAPVSDENGFTVGICGVAMDITEQKQTEDTLRETSDLLESIMEYSSSHIIIKNANGQYIRANTAFATALKVAPEEIVGKTDFDLYPEEQARFFRKIDQKVLSTQEPYILESTETILGEKRHLLVTSFPLRDANGVPNSVCVIATDITHQHAAAEAIAANERRFRAILNSVDRIAIQGYDEKRRVIFWNPSSERLYGYTREEALGQLLEDLIIPNHMRDAVIGIHDKWIQKDEPIPAGELVLRDKNGCDVEVYSSHIMYKNPDGRSEMFCVDVDLTEIKCMERELINARDVAESASRAKSEFLANMSHEIRTPLNGIMGMLQLLAADGLSGEQSRFLDIALTSCRNLTRLLSDILDLSRVEAGKMELVEEEFSMNEIIETLRPTYGDEARRKGIELHIDVENDFPDTLVGDPVRLRQVLMNLMGNAIKFTEEGFVSLEIYRFKAKNTQAFFMGATVKDTGIGISREKLAVIFEPFSQLESAYKRKFQGAGLGLSIVKRLVQLMDGVLTIDSEPGVGTTIQLSAPFSLAEAHEPEHSPGHGLSQDSMRLLLVEDDPVNSMVLRKLLEREGYVVFEASGGRHALDLLADEHIDLVLMDIQMPGMDGIEATRRIRNKEVPGLDPRIPIIALTAYAMAGDREALLQADMDDYVSKPVEINDLRTVLNHFISPAG